MNIDKHKFKTILQKKVEDLKTRHNNTSLNNLKKLDIKAKDLITAITTSWNQAIIKTTKIKKARKNWPKHIKKLKEKLIRLKKKKKRE